MPPSWIATGCLTGRGLVQRWDRGWMGGKIYFLPLRFPPCPFSPLNPYSLGEYLLAPILQSY